MGVFSLRLVYVDGLAFVERVRWKKTPTEFFSVSFVVVREGYKRWRFLTLSFDGKRLFVVLVDIDVIGVVFVASFEASFVNGRSGQDSFDFRNTSVRTLRVNEMKNEVRWKSTRYVSYVANLYVARTYGALREKNNHENSKRAHWRRACTYKSYQMYGKANFQAQNSRPVNSDTGFRVLHDVWCNSLNSRLIFDWLDSKTYEFKIAFHESNAFFFPKRRLGSWKFSFENTKTDQDSQWHQTLKPILILLQSDTTFRNIDIGYWS